MLSGGARGRASRGADRDEDREDVRDGPAGRSAGKISEDRFDDDDLPAGPVGSGSGGHGDRSMGRDAAGRRRASGRHSVLRISSDGDREFASAGPDSPRLSITSAKRPASPSDRASVSSMGLSAMDSYVDMVSDQSMVELNVGGTCFATSVETICRDKTSMLAVMVTGELASHKDARGAYFIDRDPSQFGHILNFLRNGEIDGPADEPSLRALLREAHFYQILDLIPVVESMIRKAQDKKCEVSREAVLLMLHSPGPLQLPCTALRGMLLSRLKLARANFFASDLSSSDVSGCDMEHAIFSHAYLQGINASGAILSGALLDNADCSNGDFRKAQLYLADCGKANFTGADLTRANMQDARLKGVVGLAKATLKHAILIGQDLRTADLGDAQLQGANLEKADLRGVNLAGAQLQGANLWNAQLAGANLQGANLKDANLQRANMDGVVGTYIR